MISRVQVSYMEEEDFKEHLKKHDSKYLAGIGSLGAAALGMSSHEHQEKADEAGRDIKKLEERKLK